MFFLQVLKALRTYGIDVLLLGFLEKLLGELIRKLTAVKAAVAKMKACREKRRAQPSA